MRTLCELTAKTGSLDQRFTPSPTAIEGMLGHLAVTARREHYYQTEISLTGEYQNIFVRGRADGYDPELNQLEEVKTYKGHLDRMPENHRLLHWAQAKVYAHLMCVEKALSAINVALVYYNVTSKEETLLVEEYPAASLQAFFESLCAKLQVWADQELAHRANRNKELSKLDFPYPEFRTGQRVLAESVYKSAMKQRHQLIQATTGIGKTLGTIFPLLKAMPEAKLDKVFFLTAKSSGRALGLNAIRTVHKSNPALHIRTLELTSREKSCEHPDKSCHGESCPLANGFYDRLPNARNEALKQHMMDKSTLRKVALKHQVCPYYLSQDLANWSDVVVGDYNYYFDLYALLYAGTVLNEWKVSVLVDEAHNMIERSRKMYSAELNYGAFNDMLAHAPKSLKSVLEKLNISWVVLNRSQTVRYEVYPYIPEEFEEQLQRVISRITDYLAEYPTFNDAKVLNFYFDALQFATLAESFGEHSLFDITKTEASVGLFQQDATLCIRNVVPAKYLNTRFKAANSNTLFSATLSPSSFFNDMLGLPENTSFLDVESPFAATQLKVKVAKHISTRFKERHSSHEPIVHLVARQFIERPGNYILFLSSFDYLSDVQSLFTRSYPNIPTRAQSRIMSETDKEQFVNDFTLTSEVIAFAVLGGSFGEAIDLTGDRLIGAFIATLGLPQINDVNEQMRLRMEKIFGLGYEYTYLYPGLQKVVQAAGRVIRTTDDIGVIHLMDDRYHQSKIKKLLPKWWPAPER
ncbi:MAG: ATP-dependent DNA helicase [Methylophilus sp.]|uniref:ATP-dependent DNA helicase n=1 Tax=Methylophilus sp. TaxID=29541 RepID=UPI003FA15A36